MTDLKANTNVETKTESLFESQELTFSELCDKLSGLIHGCLLAETYARSKNNMTNQSLNYWGFTTDQLLLMIKNITNSGQFEPKNYIKLLQDYSSMQGISDMLSVRGDAGESTDNLCNIDLYVKEVVFHTRALIKPVNCASQIESTKQKQNQQTDYNTPLIRCVLAGLFDNWDRLSNQVCMVTHTDHRCISAGTIYSVMVYSMLSGAKTNVIETIQETAGLITRLGKIKNENYVSEFMRYTSEGYINDISLISLESGTTAYKTMACSMYSLNSFVKSPSVEKFYSNLDELIKKGGDYETNCALAGALMGCEFGYTKLNIKNLLEIRKPYFAKFKEIEASFFKQIGFARIDEFMPKECHNENGWYLVIDYEKKKRMKDEMLFEKKLENEHTNDTRTGAGIDESGAVELSDAAADTDNSPASTGGTTIVK